MQMVGHKTKGVQYNTWRGKSTESQNGDGCCVLLAFGKYQGKILACKEMIIWSGPIKLGTAQLLPLKSQHTIHSNCKFWFTPAKVGKVGGLAKPERKNNAIYAGGRGSGGRAVKAAGGVLILIKNSVALGKYLGICWIF